MFLAIVVIGVLTHGPGTQRLGLYRDDAWNFMQAMQVAGDDTRRFILTDVAGAHALIRPGAYVPFALGRAAYAMGLPVLHWTLIFLLIADAVLLAAVALSATGQRWLALAAGAIFLTYPLSPLQAVWPSTIHYHWAALLVLVAVLLFFRGLRRSGTRRQVYLVLGSCFYLASLLTHEGNALLPLAVTIPFVASRRPRLRSYLVFIPFCVAVAIFGLWRLLVSPAYEASIFLLHGSHLIFDPATLISKAVIGLDTILLPWEDAASEVVRARSTAGDIIPALLAAVTVLAVLILLRRPSNPSGPANPGEQQAHTGSHQPASDEGSWWMTSGGMAAAFSALAIVSVASEDSISGTTEIASRVNYPALIGVALAIPGILLLLSRFDRSARVPRFIGSIVLLSIGLWHIYWLSSNNGNVLGRHYVVGLFIGCLVAVIAIGYGASLLLPRRRDYPRSYVDVRGDWKRAAGSKAAAWVPSVLVSGIVFAGAIFQTSMKADWSAAWGDYKNTLEQITRLAPGFEDNTFLLVLLKESDDRVYNRWWHRAISGSELNLYLLALYDNWSLLGCVIPENNTGELQFRQDGVEIVRGAWFQPGVKGPFWSYATTPIPLVGYERVVIFEAEAGELRPVSSWQVNTNGGQDLVLASNANRITTQPPMEIDAWRHALQ